jgi:hypothetical protein
MFTWLRAPGAGREDWLAVDAYYPGNRLVVVWQEHASDNDRVFAELVPAHGLRLLELGPQYTSELALRRRIDGLGPAPRRAAERPETGNTHQAMAPIPSHPRTASAERVTLGVLEGLALATILLVEMYVGVVGAGLDAGRVVLAFGLALDACSRALGTIAAGRALASDWAWGCALGGSPVVAVFALFRRDGPVAVEPAPLAGLMALVALVALALALVTGS